MNKTLIAERFTKALNTYSDEGNAQKTIAKHMSALLQTHLPTFNPESIVEFGCGTGNYSRLLHQMYRPTRMLLNDICQKASHSCADLIGKGVQFCAGDAETLQFPHDTQLITSCSTLQWFEKPQRFFEGCDGDLP